MIKGRVPTSDSGFDMILEHISNGCIIATTQKSDSTPPAKTPPNYALKSRCQFCHEELISNDFMDILNG